MKLNEALKRCRKLRKVTQKQAAISAGVTESMYQFYEYGKSEPTASVLISLADYFDVSLDYLVGRSDDPKRY
jgi:transcriptional regulator with XRE-family HTH domain